MGESVPNVPCEVVTEKSGKVSRIYFNYPIDAALASNYKAAGCTITPALAIPKATVEEVRKLLREAWDDTTNPGIEAAIEQALTLLGDTP